MSKAQDGAAQAGAEQLVTVEAIEHDGVWSHGGKPVEVGTRVDVTPDQAERLVKAGAVRRVG